MTALNLKELGARVREARLSLGLNQNELAEKAQLHPTYLSQIENGKANISIDVFARLVEVLQVSADWLLRADVPSVNNIKCDEISSLLSDCTKAESDAIIKMAQEFKSAIRSAKL